jgi:hypothetical protein
MKTLNRLLLVLLAAALLGATYAMHTGMTHITIGHDNYYTMKWPWLSNVHQVALYGLLAWCLFFVKSEPLFVRIGLFAVILAFILMALPAKEGFDNLPAEIRSALHR